MVRAHVQRPERPIVASGSRGFLASTTSTLITTESDFSNRGAGRHVPVMEVVKALERSSQASHFSLKAGSLKRSDAAAPILGRIYLYVLGRQRSENYCMCRNRWRRQ